MVREPKKNTKGPGSTLGCNRLSFIETLSKTSVLKMAAIVCESSIEHTFIKLQTVLFIEFFDLKVFIRLTVWKVWICKMKYNRYQDSPVIHDWSFTWVFVEKCATLSHRNLLFSKISLLLLHTLTCRVRKILTVQQRKSLQRFWPHFMAFRSCIISLVS